MADQAYFRIEKSLHRFFNPDVDRLLETNTGRFFKEIEE
jgi:hypothetical protein